jgi:hypothetical protein
MWLMNVKNYRQIPTNASVISLFSGVFGVFLQKTLKTPLFTKVFPFLSPATTAKTGF